MKKLFKNQWFWYVISSVLIACLIGVIELSKSDHSGDDRLESEIIRVEKARRPDKGL